MPDEIGVEPDKAQAPGDEQPTHGQPPEATDKGDGSGRFLMDFKSREDAEKAFKEEQAKITAQGQELAALKERYRLMEERVASVQGPDREQELDEALTKRDKEIAKKIAESEDPHLENIRLTRAMNLTVMERMEAKIAALEAKLEGEITESDPLVQEHKDTIRELMDEGLTLQQARRLVEKGKVKTTAAGKERELRADVPGRAPRSRAVGDEADVSNVSVPPFMLAQINSLDRTKDEKAALITAIKVRLAAKENRNAE